MASANKPSDYAEFTMRIKRHQKRLKPGDQVRIWTAAGIWKAMTIYSRHKAGWYNVLRSHEDVPAYSVRLLDGGRWYCIDHPNEKIDDLEKIMDELELVDPVTDLSLPVLEGEEEIMNSPLGGLESSIDYGPSIIDKENPDPANPFLLPVQKDKDNLSETMFLREPSEEQCLEAYLSLPTQDNQNIFEFHKSIEQQHPTLCEMKQIKILIRRLAINLGNLALLRIRNPRPRILIQEVEKLETQILLQLEQGYAEIEALNKNQGEALIRLERDLARTIQIYQDQKRQVIKAAEPVVPGMVKNMHSPGSKPSIALAPSSTPKLSLTGTSASLHQQPAGHETNNADTTLLNTTKTLASKNQRKILELNQKELAFLYDDNLSAKSMSLSSTMSNKDETPIPPSVERVRDTENPFDTTARVGNPFNIYEDGTIQTFSNLQDNDSNLQTPQSHVQRRNDYKHDVDKIVQNVMQSREALREKLREAQQTARDYHAENERLLHSNKLFDTAMKNMENLNRNYAAENANLLKHKEHVEKERNTLAETIRGLQQKSNLDFPDANRDICPDHDLSALTRERIRSLEDKCNQLTKQRDEAEQFAIDCKAENQGMSIQLQEEHHRLKDMLEKKIESLQLDQVKARENMENRERLLLKKLTSQMHSMQRGSDSYTDRPKSVSFTNSQDQGKRLPRLDQEEHAASSLVTGKATSPLSRIGNNKFAGPARQARRTPQTPIAGLHTPDVTNTETRRRFRKTGLSTLEEEMDEETNNEEPEECNYPRKENNNSPFNQSRRQLTDRSTGRRAESPHDNSHLLNAALKSYLEDIDELNTDIQELISNGDSILAEKQDGAIKELKRTITTDFSKLKDQSRKIRSAFRLEARRRLSDEVAEEVIQNSIMETNLQLTQEASEVIRDVNSWIKERGLDLLQTSVGKETKIVWPTFTGQNLPLVGDFLTELEELMIRAGTPVSDRGAVLNQHVGGQAKSIVKDATHERNPSFKHLAGILRAHFGQPGTQIDLLQRLHQKHGAIPSVNDLSVSMIDIYNIVKNHITLLKAASSLHQQHLAGEIKENPLSGSYVNAIENYLPREDVKQLTSIPDYHLMETQHRFCKIYEAFKNIQHFASTQIAKHGYDNPIEPKRRTKHPLFVAANPPIASSSANSTAKIPPPIFSASPPTVPLPLPPATTRNSNIQCFRCKGMGHYANSCPSKPTLINCSKCSAQHAPGPCPLKPVNNNKRNHPIVHNPTTGEVTTTMNNDVINLQPCEQNSGYFSGSTTCILCQTEAQHANKTAAPSPHIFMPSGRLERLLCPSMTKLASMEARVAVLDQWRICKACLNSSVDNAPSHSGTHCQALDRPNTRHLKCAQVNCPIRYTLCVEHRSQNQEKINVYMNHTHQQSKINICMISGMNKGINQSKKEQTQHDAVCGLLRHYSTLNRAPTECLIATCNGKTSETKDLQEFITNKEAVPVLNARANFQTTGLFDEVRALIENIPQPFMPVSETPHHFQLFLMQGKDPKRPIVVCFDTASAYTILTEHAVQEKLGGNLAYLPGTSLVSGIGGEKTTRNLYCGFPLNPELAGGYAAKIMSCLLVDSIVEIDTVDITGIEEFLKSNYADQLPDDFTLFNFRDLGSKIHIDCLVGIDDIKCHPRLILTTSEGLNVYQVPIQAAEKGSQYCIGGNVPCEFHDQEDSTAISYTAHEIQEDKVQKISMGQSISFNLDDPHFLGEDIHEELASHRDEFEDLGEVHGTPSEMALISLPATQEEEVEELNIRPNLIVTSPLPPSLARDIIKVQAEMMDEYPGLSAFAVPPNCLHITHLALKIEGSPSKLFEDALTEMHIRQLREENCSMPAITVAIGAQKAFNGNICVEVTGTHLEVIRESVKKECCAREIYFDPVHQPHVTIFRKDYHSQGGPNIGSMRSIGPYVKGRDRELEFVDLCLIKRKDKSKYFDIIHRADMRLGFEIVDPKESEPILTSVISGTHRHLSRSIKGLCTDHGSLLDAVMPSLDDWRNVGSVQSIINDIFPPLGTSPTKSTIPVRLFDLLSNYKPIKTQDQYQWASPSMATSASQRFHDSQFKAMFEEDNAVFRCLSCRLCPSCSAPGQGGSGHLSLREETENLLIRNSVSIDLSQDRIVARHVLPSNYLELLGDNKAHCELRLRNQLRKLAQRSKKEQEQVKASIKKLHTRGFISSMDELSELERKIIEDNQSAYYIPTSIVFKETSLSTPSRVCMDGSAKTSTGYSLNDLMVRGSVSLDIGSLIQNWKALPIAASGDLASYYCRFSLSPEFWPIQKFLWNDQLDSEGPLKTYYIKTIIYGLKSSGLVCHYGINKLIDIFEHLKALTLYVDDAVAGYFEINEAKKEVEKIAATLSRFNLPFKGSTMAITGEMPPKEIIDENGAVGISCARWNPVDDTFTCSVPPLFLGQANRGSLAGVDICKESDPQLILKWLPDTFTLKQLLSKVATYFDGQLGIMCALTGPLRFLVRKVLTLSKDSNGSANWSFPVPMEDRVTFSRQIAEIKKLGSYKYRRFPKVTSKILPSKKGILVCFSDSADLQTVIVYLGLMQEDGKICFNLITARTYLILNDLTLPKSELQAAAHGANAVQSVIEHFQGKLELTPHLLIDSECSLHWVANSNSLLQVFHRNRVAAIVSVFGQNVYHVQTQFNLADDISRLNTAAEHISPASRFYNGPDWLRDGFDAAQQAEIISPMSKIARTTITPHLLDTFKSGVILSQYSDLNTVKLKKKVRESQNDQKAEQYVKISEEPTPEACGSAPEEGLFTSKETTVPQVTTPTLTNAQSLVNKDDFHIPTTCTECKVDVPVEQRGIFYSSCVTSKDQHAYCHVAPKVSAGPAPQMQHIWDNFEPDLEEEIPNSHQHAGGKKHHPAFMASEGNHNLKLTNKLINQLITTRAQAKERTKKQGLELDENEEPELNDADTRTTVDSASAVRNNEAIPDAPTVTKQNTSENIEQRDCQGGRGEMNNQLWAGRTKRIARETQYLISPLGKPLSTVLQAGATALRFLDCLIERMLQKSTKKTWSRVKTKLSSSSKQTQITSMIISPPPKLGDEDDRTSDEPSSDDNSCLACVYRKDRILKPVSRATIPKHGDLLRPTSALIKSKALHYPGVAFTQETLRMYEKCRSRRKLKPKSARTLLQRVTMAKMLSNSLLYGYSRPTGENIGHLINQNLKQLEQEPGTSKYIRSMISRAKKEGATYSEFLGFNGQGNPWDDVLLRPRQKPDCIHAITFPQIMKSSYAVCCKYVHLCMEQLIASEQTTLRKQWSDAKISRHCTEVNGILMSNTRWRPSVNNLSNFLTKDPDAINISENFHYESCPVLDKDSPLYISIAQHVHTSLNLPKRSPLTLSQKHRGVCQDLQQSLAFAYAPGGIATLRRVRDSCFTCTFRNKKYLKTREGDVHWARLIFVKPFFSSHIDLMGPLFIKLHDTAATRNSDNERKIWLLCTVCAFTRAIWVEAMQGTGTPDVSDALTRTMSFTGSIGHLITDRLASQLKVAKEGAFFEQIQHRLFRRLGWFSTIIPVSRHNQNAMVENRIKAMRSMLCLENNHTGMKLLEFITLTRVATNLINAIPLGYTLKNAGNNEELKVISPSSFLFPLMSMERPILSPIMVNEQSKYFDVMQNAYQNLLQRFSDSVIPYLMQKHHKFQEYQDSDPLAIDHIVLFKKKPGSWAPGWNIGRVVKVYPSRDGTIRSVTIEYINRNVSDKEEMDTEDSYDTKGMPEHENIRNQADKNMQRIHTTRQADELIRLHPILPRENDVNDALRGILQAERRNNQYQLDDESPLMFN